MRRYPKEYIESLWARKGHGDIEIVEFRKLPHTATRGSVEFDPDDFEVGESEGNILCIGTIHSHPFGELRDADAAPSEHDWDLYRSEGEIVSAVFGIWKRDGRRCGRVRFFFSQAALDVRYGK